MKHPGIVAAAAVLLAAGCTRDDPLAGIDVAIERAPAADGDALRYTGTAARSYGVAFELVEMAIAGRADEICDDARVEFGDGGTLYNGVADDPEVGTFQCLADAIPGMTVLRAGAAMPEQPPLAAGHARMWAATLTHRKPVRATFDGLLGATLSGLYLGRCGGQGLVVERLATYRQAAPAPVGDELTIWVDYRCVADAASTAGAGAD